MPDKKGRPKVGRAKPGLPTVEQLNSLFHCDPHNGVLRWKAQPYWRESQRLRHEGKIVGHKGLNGYIRTQWCRRIFLVHRIIWKMTTGKDPKANIDHINGIRHDNRIANLREATHSQNCMNKIARVGKREPKGVYFNRGRYNVKIGIGSYDTMEEASAAYDRVARILFGEFARSK